MKPHSQFKNRVPAAAFTLIEMLIVVATLAILLGSATPALLGMMKSSRLTGAGDLVLGQLNEAQFIALSEFTDVEVRIYEMPDFSVADSDLKLRGIQLHVLRPLPADQAGSDSTQEAFQPAAPIARLGRSVEISRNDTFSSFMSLPFKTDPESPFGPGGANLRYIAFRFHSDGSTDLLGGQPWFLTLTDQDVDPASNTTPPNFFTIQIDTTTGKLRIFRP